MYREVVESPYTRLNQSEVETDSFENLKRVSTVELLRRRGDSDIGTFVVLRLLLIVCLLLSPDHVRPVIVALVLDAFVSCRA